MVDLEKISLRHSAEATPNSRRPYLSSLLIAGAITISILAFGISTASADVQVDPDGPAGQQYALPVDSVRGEAAGDPSAGVPGAAAPAPIFGQGIRPGGKPGKSKGGPDRSDGKGKKAGFGEIGNGTRATGTSLTDPELEALINGAGGSSNLLEMILMIGGMALVGLTAGLIGRRTP